MFNAFENYSFEVLFLALAVVVITSFVKRVIFRNKYKKIITFVPFLVGIGLQLLYKYIVTKSALSILCAQTVKAGIITGGVGTVYYVFYEQFIRGKKVIEFSLPKLAVEGILSAIVVKEKISEAAAEITETVKNNLHDKGYCQSAIYDILSGKLISGVTNQDIIAYSKLIITTLSAM